MMSVRRIAVISIMGLLFIAVAALGYVQSSTTFRDSETYAQRMKICEIEALRDLRGPAKQSWEIADLQSVSDYCFNDILNSDNLSESSITRGMYIHQRYENNVILFMVVLITLSGVVLAGLQLWTSYNLAATGHLQGDGATELSVEQGKLAIKSTVSGLVVLALSLAFFALYVLKVYTITSDLAAGAHNAASPVDSAAATTTAKPPLPAFEQGGGAGAPP